MWTQVCPYLTIMSGRKNSLMYFWKNFLASVWLLMKRSDLARRAAEWQLPPPKWTYCCDGTYELRTPFWLMRLERFFGWRVTRDGVPLVWLHNQSLCSSTDSKTQKHVPYYTPEAAIASVRLVERVGSKAFSF